MITLAASLYHHKIEDKKLNMYNFLLNKDKKQSN